jgi:hypothetical protein
MRGWYVITCVGGSLLYMPCGQWSVVAAGELKEYSMWQVSKHGLCVITCRGFLLYMPCWPLAGGCSG